MYFHQTDRTFAVDRPCVYSGSTQFLHQTSNTTHCSFSTAKTDTKGRVFIPAGFRKQLQAASEERLVLRKDVFQDCLILYPESVWFKTQNQLRQRLNKWNAKHQQIFRQFVSDAEIMIPDGNGRILLPKRYLQMAGIQGEVRFIGVDNTIEIWAKEKAEQPFMNPEEFSEALQDILGEENLGEEEAETSDKSVE